MAKKEDLPELKDISGKILCPSYRCTEGALLLGIVKSDGVVAFMEPPLPVTAEFVQIATSKSRTPEKRFRFAGPCQTCKCSNWNKGLCEIVELAVACPSQRKGSNLPDCSIRPECKWFIQRGAEACHVCPEITTEDPVQI